MFECGGQNWSVSMLTWTLFTVIFFLGGGGGGGGATANNGVRDLDFSLIFTAIT